MSALLQNDKNHSRTIDQLLRNRTRLDMVFNVDHFGKKIDIRQAYVLEIQENIVVISQSIPPTPRSHLGRQTEVTFVYHDPGSGETTRWGWIGKFLSLHSDYPLEGGREAVAAISVSLPEGGHLKAANVRLGYRMRITDHSRIGISTKPDLGRTSLEDFSSRGLMVAVPPENEPSLGQRLGFSLKLPVGGGPLDQIKIGGEAEVVRVATVPSDALLRLGLCFTGITSTDTRALQRAINFHMREERREKA